MRFIFFILVFILANIHAIKAQILFDKEKPFELVNIKSGITNQSSEKDSGKCNNWTISPELLPIIIKESKEISGEDWHHLFEVWPCIISGQLKQNGEVYNVEINAGSWLTVSHNRETIRFGYFQKEYKKYFLSDAWDGN